MMRYNATLVLKEEVTREEGARKLSGWQVHSNMYRCKVAPKAESLDVWCVEAQEGAYGGGIAVPSHTPGLALHVMYRETTLHQYNHTHLI